MSVEHNIRSHLFIEGPKEMTNLAYMASPHHVLGKFTPSPKRPTTDTKTISIGTVLQIGPNSVKD